MPDSQITTICCTRCEDIFAVDPDSQTTLCPDCNNGTPRPENHTMPMPDTTNIDAPTVLVQWAARGRDGRIIESGTETLYPETLKRLSIRNCVEDFLGFLIENRHDKAVRVTIDIVLPWVTWYWVWSLPPRTKRRTSN